MVGTDARRHAGNGACGRGRNCGAAGKGHKERSGRDASRQYGAAPVARRTAVRPSPQALGAQGADRPVKVLAVVVHTKVLRITTMSAGRVDRRIAGVV